jgi:hypothetical protein
MKEARRDPSPIPPLTPCPAPRVRFLVRPQLLTRRCVPPAGRSISPRLRMVRASRPASRCHTSALDVLSTLRRSPNHHCRHTHRDQLWSRQRVIDPCP